MDKELHLDYKFLYAYGRKKYFNYIEEPEWFFNNIIIDRGWIYVVLGHYYIAN